MTALTFVTTGLGTGGAETMLLRLITSLPTKFRCSVLSLMDAGTYGDALRRYGVPVMCVHMRPGRPTMSGFLTVRRLIAGARPQLVHGWMYHGNMAAVLGRMTGAFRAPVLWNIRHALNDFPGERPMTRAIVRAGVPLSRCTARVVYVSEVSRQQHEQLGYDRTRGVVVKNGYDLEEFRPDPRRRELARREFDACSSDVVVGQVARWHPIKGHSLLIRAAEQVLRQQPHALFVLIGSGCDERNRIIVNELGRSGVGARFRLLGERSDIASLLPGLDVIAQPSLSEGFPNVLCEAGACGVPAVATRVGGTAEAAGGSAILVDPGDPTALAEALGSIIKMPLAERTARGQAARRHVSERFSLSVAAAAYASLYEKVLREIRESGTGCARGDVV